MRNVNTCGRADAGQASRPETGGGNSADIQRPVSKVFNGVRKCFMVWV